MASTNKSSAHVGQEFDEAKFEVKKRRIAMRLKTEEELEASRLELGGRGSGVAWGLNPKARRKKEEEAFDLNVWVKDTILYFLFLFAFTFTIFTGRSTSDLITYQELWKSTIASSGFDSVRTRDGVLDFLDELIINKIGGAENPFQDPGYSYESRFGSSYGSALLGSVSLKQSRVEAGECSRIHSKFVSHGTVHASDCYPYFSEEFAAITFTRENATAANSTSSMFAYESKSEVGGFPGFFGFYGNDGFVVDLYPTSNAADMLEEIRGTNWLDFKTRALVVDYMFYNPDADLFADTRLLFEFLPSGGIQNTAHVNVISLNRYPGFGFSGIFRMATMVFVYLCVMYFFLAELDYCRIHGLKKFKKMGWAYLDVLNITLFFISGIIKVANLILVLVAFPAKATENTIRTKIRAAGEAFYIEDQINGLNGFLLWLKMFKYVGVTRRMGHLTQTVLRSLHDIVTYLFLFWIISFAFGILAYMLFGAELEEYATLSDALVTVYRAMYGDVNFLQTLNTSGPLGFIFLFVWLVVSVTVLLNMVIAILTDVYAHVRELEEEDPQMTQLELVMREVKKLKQQYFGDMIPSGQAEQTQEKEISWFGVLFGTRAVAWMNNMSDKLMKDKEELEVEEEEDDASNEDSSEDEIGQPKALPSLHTMQAQWKPWPSRQVAPEPQAPPPTEVNMAPEIVVYSKAGSAKTLKDVDSEAGDADEEDSGEDTKGDAPNSSMDALEL